MLSDLLRHTCVVSFVFAAIGTLTGCGTITRDSRQFANLTPTAPAMSGTFDFDILDDVAAKGCVTVGAMKYTATISGTRLAGLTLVEQAEAAAVFNALAQVRGADLLFISRMLTDSELEGRACATVWGRAVRLKKGPTIAPSTPPTVPPAPVPTPMPVPLTPSPEAPRPATPGF